MGDMTKREARAHYGVNGTEARRLERALCTLADFGGTIALSLAESARPDRSLGDVRAALRRIIDGEGR